MSSIHVKGISVNPRPLVLKLASKYGQTTSFTDLVPKIADGEISVEPGDLFECITHGKLQGGKVGIGDLQEGVLEYLSSPEAHMIYHGALLKRAVRFGQEVKQIVYSQTVELDTPGETDFISSEGSDVKLAFPHCELEPLTKGSGMVSLYGFDDKCHGMGRVEITHIGGFDKEIEIHIPTHVGFEDEEGLEPAVLSANVKLPRKPKNLTRLTCLIKNNIPAIIDIGKLGLCVPLGGSTFTINVMYETGGINSFVLQPRIINGLIIAPQDLGKTLKVSLASKTHETKKIILTNLYDKNDNIVPVKLTVNISD